MKITVIYSVFSVKYMMVCQYYLYQFLTYENKRVEKPYLYKNL